MKIPYILGKPVERQRKGTHNPITCNAKSSHLSRTR